MERGETTKTTKEVRIRGGTEEKRRRLDFSGREREEVQGGARRMDKWIDGGCR